MVVENFRPDVKHRLGIDYETLRKINPRIVYGSISGFGQDGPYRDRPGFDQIAQGMGGLMSITGLPGRGPDARRHPDRRSHRRPVLRARHPDRAARARGVRRRASGCTTSLLQAQIFMLDFQAARWLMEQRGRQAGRQQPSDQHPDRRVQDHRRLHQHRRRPAQKIWERFCQAIGAPET